MFSEEEYDKTHFSNEEMGNEVLPKDKDNTEMSPCDCKRRSAFFLLLFLDAPSQKKWWKQFLIDS